MGLWSGELHEGEPPFFLGLDASRKFCVELCCGSVVGGGVLFGDCGDLEGP